jgi:hypothetical protein
MPPRSWAFNSRLKDRPKKFCLETAYTCRVFITKIKGIHGLSYETIDALTDRPVEQANLPPLFSSFSSKGFPDIVLRKILIPSLRKLR